MTLGLEKHLKIILFVALVVRLAVVIALPPERYNEDGIIAANLAKGLGYTLNGVHPTAYKSPVYPLFLASVFALFGGASKGALFTVGLIQATLGIVTVYLVALLAKEVINSRAAVVIALLIGFYPSYVYYVRVIEVTNCFIAVFALNLLVLFKTINFPSLNNSALFGLLCGISILTNPVASVACLVMMVFLVLGLKKKGLPWIARTLTAACCLLLILLPWSLRNLLELGAFVPIKSPLGWNLFMGFREESTGREIPLSTSELQKLAEADKLEDEIIRDRIYLSVMADFIYRNPQVYATRCFERVLYYWWVPHKYVSDNSLSLWAVRKLPVLVLLLSTLLCFPTWMRSAPFPALMFLLVLLSFTFVYMMTFAGNVRFKLDVEWLQFFPIGFFLEKTTSSHPA